MPEAGRTPAPAYERGNTLQYGEANEANQLMGLVAEGPEPDPYAPSGDEEEFLFSQTDRPDEPITAGAPVGPGPDLSRHAIETPAAFKQRLLAQMEQRGNQSREVRAFIEKARRGL